MPANFEWQTEEERQEVWEPASQEPSDPAGGRSRWLIVLLLLLVGTALYAGYRQASRRVLEAEGRVGEEVMSSDRLARTTASNGDRELFVTVLSGRERSWTETQRRLFEEKLLFGGAARVLGLEPEGDEVVVEDVVFDPQLREAQLLTQVRYTSPPSNEAVTLQQVHVYRRGETRWLLAPPQSEFWGEWQSWQGRHLALTYPARDAQLMEQMAPDLDETLEQMCTTLSGLTCPPDFRIRLRLEKEPDSLLLVHNAALAPVVAGELDLPAPSLIGLPLEEDGYRVLHAAYARQVVGAAIRQLVQYRCCQQLLFFQATVDWQLYQLGLQRWPLELKQYLQIVENMEPYPTMAREWAISDAVQALPLDRWRAHSLVELLLVTAGTEVNAVHLQQALRTSGDPLTWSRAVADYRSIADLGIHWREYLLQRIQALQRTPPMPEEELILACQEGGCQTPYGYNPQPDRWSRGLLGLDDPLAVNQLLALPDDRGLLASVGTFGLQMETPPLFSTQQRLSLQEIYEQVQKDRFTGGEHLLAYQRLLTPPSRFSGATTNFSSLAWIDAPL